MIYPVPKPGRAPKKVAPRLKKSRLRVRRQSPAVRDFLAAVSELACWLCGKHPADPDHWVRRSARGKKHPEKHFNNVWPLCRRHHDEKHKIGPERFAERHQVNPVEVCKAVTAMWQEGRAARKILGGAVQAGERPQ